MPSPSPTLISGANWEEDREGDFKMADNSEYVHINVYAHQATHFKANEDNC